LAKAKRGGIFHYVPLADAPEWEAIGWVRVDDAPKPDGKHPSLYRWAGDGKVRIPYLNEERDRELSDFDYIWPDPSGEDG